MKLVLAGILLFCGQAFALELSDCNQAIFSKKLLEASEKGFERVNRMSTAYTAGFETTDRQEAGFCPSASTEDEVTVATVVTAQSWSEEESMGLMVSECFLRLERQEGDWVPVYLTCEDFGIDEDLD